MRNGWTNLKKIEVDNAIVVFENLSAQQFFKVANFGIILERHVFVTPSCNFPIHCC